MPENGPAIPYRTRWRRKALEDTGRSWTPSHVLETLVAPVIAPILWILFKPWNGWEALMQIAAISVLAFLALWGLVFIAHAALTPARLDRECAKGFNEVIDRHVKEFQAKDAALNEYAKKVA